MSLTAFILVVGFGVPLLGGVIVVVLYNRLVVLRNAARGAWSQIDVQLKRRHDLVPNLVAAVQGYAAHERETLASVISARGAAQSAQGMTEKARAEGVLGTALLRLVALAESYPELKANENFLALQEELSSTENKIAFARQHYNDRVQHFDNAREAFPSNLIAGLFGFRALEYFAAEQATRTPPAVKF